MKKATLLFLIIFTGVQLVKADSIQRGLSNLPTKSNDFLNEWFSGIKVNRVILDQSQTGKSFGIEFINGVSIDFNEEGDWTTINGKWIELPAGILPSQIVQLIEKDYSGLSIVKIESERKQWKIKLINQQELTIDKSNYAVLKTRYVIDKNKSNNQLEPIQKTDISINVSYPKETILDFLNEWFPAVETSYLSMGNQKDNSITFYLRNGVKVEFTDTGKLKAMEGQAGVLPVKILPDTIPLYIEENYPGQLIIQIEQNTEEWGVTLHNQKKLTFTRKGEIIN